MPRRLPRDPRGRRSHLTRERHDRIIEIISAGNHLATAADVAGIGESTLYQWLQLGRDARAARDRGERLSRRALEYAEFAESVTRARATATIHAIGVVHKAMEGGYVLSEKETTYPDGKRTVARTFAAADGRLALEFVSRQAPDLWGRNGVARVELTGPDGGSIAVEESTMAAALAARFQEVLDRRAEERRELEAARLDPDADDVFEGG
jgi:hypothetical protein